ncbi:ABC transporter permease subunit [Limosilactobacillus sp.]|uniref:ABC transporter permease subunit n=1 Tax=Limosilactobacillus sp. TaxID=2773925 RepID=UPI003EFE4DE9
MNDRVKVDHALAVITQDVIKQATVAITAGADGIYYSTQAIQDDRLDHHDFKELVEKYDRQIIRAANQLSDTNILHICGNGGAYIAYFRGIPLVIHLFIVYYGLPILLTAILPPLFGVSTVKLQRLDPLYAIIIAYTLYTAAFMSEIIRGAYQAVDRQQLDAAQALGYTSWQTYRFIKLPQALVEALPKLLNY